MNEFIIINGNPSIKKNIAIEKSWFNHCAEEKIPYVTINSKRTKADIHWDYITINPENDEALFNNDKLTSYLIGVFQATADKTSKYDLSPVLGTFYSIPVELAERAAEAIYFGLSNEIKSFESQQTLRRSNA